jgi:predicted amidohydrolase YtcJ
MGHEPVLDISAKVARGVIRSWTKRKHDGYWQPIRGQSQAKGFLKNPSAKIKELENYST